jgi:hypothetical protein
MAIIPLFQERFKPGSLVLGVVSVHAKALSRILIQLDVGFANGRP